MSTRIKSFTVSRFHLNNAAGLTVIDEILECLSGLELFRPAGPGEFTKRAVLNGKLTISQATSINHLVNSETSRQKRHAITSLIGDKRKGPFWDWKDRLIECQAAIEACLNFAEDDNIDCESATDQVLKDIKIIMHEMSDLLTSVLNQSKLHRGIKVAIVGAPNAGKSSLINLISHQQMSIVSPSPGTTRDPVRAFVDFRGWPLVFVDTAGLRLNCHDEVEHMGVDRALTEAQEADIIIHMSSVDIVRSSHFMTSFSTDSRTFESTVKTLSGSKMTPQSDESVESHSFNLMTSQIAITTITSLSDDPEMKLSDDVITSKLLRQAAIEEKPVIRVLNKIDLLKDKGSHEKQIAERLCEDMNCVLVSCHTNDGISELLNWLNETLKSTFSNDEHFFAANCSSYQKEILQDCVVNLKQLLSVDFDELVMQAEYLKSTLSKLSRQTDQPVLTDSMLDKVFANFCIGK